MGRAVTWFVASGSDGFTSDPEQAKKINGYPIACPGGLNNVWKKHFSEDKAKSDAVFELLLDAIEDEQREQALGLAKAVAVLRYGAASDENLDKVRADADAAFEEE